MSDSLAHEQAIFTAARATLSSDERQAYLRSACGSNAALQVRVEALLRAFDESPNFLESPLSPFESKIKNIPQDQSFGAMIGPYKLLEVIGEGGMGVVYRAEQTEPVARLVALKIIKPGMDSREVVARFGAERQSLALMNHPHIATVLDAGTTERGLAYFAMELVHGVPITDHCDELRLTLRERLELFVLVCRAIQHAHQKGIIHRDIKPTNILVARHEGQSIPKVIDFGVAKAIRVGQSEHTIHTAVWQIIGTPLYMSPEQAEMNAVDVDTRSDVYSLGVLLYELLTGAAPFDKKRLQAVGMDEMRRMLREVEPPCPSARLSTLSAEAISSICELRGLDMRRLHHYLKGELDWIVMKALDKNPDRRYATANDLAEDIVRYLNDVPIFASPSPWWLRLKKWRRRHPAWTVLSVAISFLLAVLVAGASWHNARLSALLTVSEHLKREGLTREEVLYRELYANDMQRVSYLLAAGKNVEAQQILARHQTHFATRAATGLEWAYLWNLTQKPDPVRVFRGHSANVLTADVTFDHKLLASGDRSGLVKIWDLATGVEIQSLQCGDQEVTCVRFSPNGKLLATASQDRTIRLWTVGSWTESKRLEKHTRTVSCVTWSPNSLQLASSGRDNLVHIWDCVTGNVQATLPEHTDVVRCLAWSPNGKWLATADGNRGVLMWQTANWTLHGILPCKDDFGNSNSVLSIAFSHYGEMVAYGGYGQNVRVAETDSLLEIGSVATGQVWSLAFLSEAILAVGTKDKCRLLHISRHHRTIEHLLRADLEDAGTLRATIGLQEGRFLVTASEQERTIKIWESAALLGFQEARFDERPVALAPADGIIASTPYFRAGVPFTAKFLRIRRSNDSSLARIEYETVGGCLPVFSADGGQFAVPSQGPECVVRKYDTRTWQQVQQLKLPGPLVSQLSFSHDSNWLAATDPYCLVGVWSTRDGAWHEVLPQHPSLERVQWQTSVAFSPKENLLAAARWNDKQITLWRPDRGIVSQRMAASNTHALAFSPDGNMLAAESGRGISLWDVASGNLIGELLFSNEKSSQHINNLAFSPDGATLAGTVTDSTVRLWDVKSLRELLSMMLPGQPYLLQYRASGQLAVACKPSTVVLFDPARD